MAFCFSFYWTISKTRKTVNLIEADSTSIQHKQAEKSIDWHKKSGGGGRKKKKSRKQNRTTNPKAHNVVDYIVVNQSKTKNCRLVKSISANIFRWRKEGWNKAHSRARRDCVLSVHHHSVDDRWWRQYPQAINIVII